MNTLFKNSALRRVFSLVLSFCMMIGLMPTFTFAADNVEPTIQSYEWRIVSPYQRRGTDTSIKQHADYALNQVTSYDMIDTFESQISSGKYDTVEGRLTTSANWMYAGESGTPGSIVFTDEDGGILLPNVGDWISFLIKVDADGSYDMSARVRFNSSYGAITEIYLAPKGDVTAAADSIASKYLIGTVDQHLNREKTSGDSSVPLASNVALTAGEYYVTYKVARESTASDASTYIQNFKLTPHDASAEKSASPVITPAEREFLYTTDVTVDSASQVATSSATKDRAFYKTGVDSYWENPAAVIRMSTVPLSTSKPVDASPIKFTISEKTKVSAVATDWIGRNGVSSFKAPSDSVNVTFTPTEVVVPELARSLTYDLKKAYGETVSGITYEMTDSDSETQVNSDITSDPWAYNAGSLAYDEDTQALSVTGTASIKVKVEDAGEYTPAISLSAAANVKFYALGTSEALAEKAADAGVSELCDKALALAAGEYVFEITSTEAVLVDALALNLVPYDLEYNFTKGWNGNTAYNYVATLTNYDVMTEGATLEMNPNIKSHPWAFHSTTSANAGNDYFKYNNIANGLILATVRTNVGYGAMKIKVPVTGKYVPSVMMTSSTNGSTVISLSKLNDDGSIGEEVVKNDNILVSATGEYKVSAEPVEISAGEYVLKMAGVAGPAMHCITGFKLDAVYGISSLIQLDSEGIATMDVEEEIVFPLDISMTGDAEVDWSKVSVNVTLGKTDIASATANVADGSASVTFKGLAVGKDVATVTVTNGETEATRKLNIVVNEAGTSTTVRDLYYDFMKGWAYNTALTFPASITYSMTTSGSIDEINKSVKTEPWAFHSSNSTGGNNYFKYNGNAYALCKSQTGFGALKIKIPASGNYQPFATLHHGSSLPVTMSLCKLNEDGSIGDAIVEKAGIETSKNQVQDYALCDDQIYLEAGEYVIRLAISGSPGLGIINGFKLINLDKKLNLENATLSVIKGESGKLALNVTDYAGNKIKASESTFSMTVADSSYATVTIAAEGEDIVVSADALKIGSTTATINVVTNDGKEGTFTLPISVTADFDLVIDMPVNEMVEYGKDTTIPISVRSTDIKTGADQGDVAATITAEVTGENLGAKVEYGTGNIGNSLVLTGNALGTSKLTVTIAVGEVVRTYVYPILVYSNEANTSTTYEFNIKKSIAPNNVNISTVDSYFKTMPGTGVTMKASDTATWMYAGQSADTVFKNYYSTYGAALEAAKGSWGAIKVRLPEAGIYQITTMGTRYPMSGIMRVYVAPADAENPMDPKYAIGSADNYMAGTKDDVLLDQVYTLGTGSYQAGDYIVTWENIGQNSGCIAGTNSRLYMDGVRFVPKTELPEIDVTAESYSATFRQYNTTTIPVSATVSDGTEEDLYGAEFVFTPSVEGIVNAKTIVNAKGKTEIQLESVGVGETTLKVEVKRQGVVRDTFDINVNVLKPGTLSRVDVGVVGSALNTIPLHVINTESNQGQLQVSIYDEDGVEISDTSAEAQGVTFSYASADPSIAAVDPVTGHIDAYKAGEVEVSCTVTLGSTTVVGKVILNVTNGKTRQSYYTAEKVEAMRENAELYSWARTTAESYARAADKYIGDDERLWNLITTQELPRAYYVGNRGDPDGVNAVCRYCGVSIAAKYGSSYGWLYDAWNDPWKVQCPDCRRKFPSNDFAGFYEIGIDEHGNWSYELAKQKNAELVAAGEDGYLKNILYPEKGEGWAVDDGYGYRSGNMITNTEGNPIPEADTYIAFYHYWALYANCLYPAISNIHQAYLYTGEEKYGRAGAILIDRLADVYPDYDFNAFPYMGGVPGTYSPNGVFTDYVWENQYAQTWSIAYDAFWPMYEDEYVINFLSEKAEKYNMENDKSTPALIRTNIEDGLLREMWIESKKGNIYGNFGMFQTTISNAAVVLDTLPETADMLDWVMRDGEYNYGTTPGNTSQVCEITGGNVLSTLIDKVDRDGSSDEVAPNYTAIWVNGVRRVADAIEGYDKYPSADLYNNPRYISMLTYQQDLLQRRATTPSIGDSGATSLDSIYYSSINLSVAFRMTQDPFFAQMLYFLNGNKSAGLHYEANIKNPNRLATEVQAVIDEYGEWDFDQSSNLTDMGFAALRDGTYYKVSGQDDVDTQRSFWMYYGRSAGHGHHDALNLGIEALGLTLAPDFGYPMSSTGDDYTNWGHSTVQHNTVVVNNSSQSGNTLTGVPYHFDDDGHVAVMEADGTHQYSGLNDYRRAVVMVNADNENSYGVDFFHVDGGNEHVYAFHAYSDTIAETVGLDNLTPQADADGNYIGSYAGAGVPWKTMGNRSGFTYLYNVDRAANVAGGNFEVDFKIKDFRNQLDNEGDLRLRMTMLNGFDLSEVAIASGDPPARDNNPQGLKFVLARRSGSNLDTLFTTVFEPYEDNRFIESMEAVSVARADGAEIADGEIVRAVKVTLTNGREDYVVYAMDNTVEYVIGGLFNMRGAIGVYSMQDGKNVYSYVNDGDKIGDVTGLGTVTGKIVDFTREIVFDNYIDVTINEDIDPSSLIGEYIYIDRAGSGNGTYKIKDVTGEGKNLTLYVGNVTTIDATAGGGEYLYHMEEGADFRIPLSISDDASPVFDTVGKKSVEAGSELIFTVNAESELDAEITYRAGTLPRGAQFDPATGRFAWIPDSAQIGNHLATIIASNGALESVLEVEIQVYNATGGTSPSAGVTTPGSMGPGSTTDPDDGKTDEEDKPDVTISESDSIDFTASADSANTASTKLGSVEFESGYFAEDGEGTLEISREGNEFDITLDTSAETAEGEMTVTLNYTPGADETDTDAIIVRDADGNIIKDAKYADGKITFTTNSLGQFTVDYNAKRFIDLGNHKWAEDAIYRLAARGVINGTSENTYSPGNAITRADFTTLIVRAFGFTAETTESFPDVESGKYYTDTIAIAKALGIVNGDGKGNFNPMASITRQDMMVIIARAASVAGIDLSGDVENSFPDMDKVSDYAKDAVELLISSGIIAGSNGLINPLGTTTRAEVAVILDRLIFFGR